MLAAAVIATATACERSASPPASARTDTTVTVGGASSEATARDSGSRAPSSPVIDTTLPIAEQVKQFRAAIGGPTLTALVNASPSRDALLQRFAGALERRDTTAFRQMIVNAREFIDLIYPDSPFASDGFRPTAVWSVILSTTAAGFARLLETRGGKPLGAVGMTCADRGPNREGKNLIWNQCLVRIRDANGTERREQLFGSIIERGGRFKFISYANRL